MCQRAINMPLFNSLVTSIPKFYFLFKINSISKYNTNYKFLRGLSPFEGLGASA